MSSDGQSSQADQTVCTAQILEETPDAAIVSNLGIASYVLAGVEDRSLNFYLWGSMGVTSPVGLGMAMNTDRPVTVLDGDGSMLMSLGALSTVATYNPSNLTIIVWNNGVYGTTGGQTNLSDTTDFAGVANAVGLQTYDVSSNDEFADAYREAQEYNGATMIACDVELIDPDPRPSYDFSYIKSRFYRAMNDREQEE